MALLKAYLLQHEHSDNGPRPEFSAFQDIPLKKATAKLRQHYERLGFERFARTEFMFRSTSHQHNYVRFELAADVLATLVEKADELPI